MIDGASFAQGFALGIGAAVPLGPINILIMNRALERYHHAVLIGLGAMSADMIYLSLSILGIIEFARDGSAVRIFSIAGSAFLLYLAFSIYRGAGDVGKEESPPKVKRLYPTGLVLTLFNPYTVMFWLSVSAYMHSAGLDYISTLVGLFTAITGWILLMPLAIYRSRHLLSGRITKIFSIISSMLLLFFAISMMIEGFTG